MRKTIFRSSDQNCNAKDLIGISFPCVPVCIEMLTIVFADRCYWWQCISKEMKGKKLRNSFLLARTIRRVSAFATMRWSMFILLRRLFRGLWSKCFFLLLYSKHFQCDDLISISMYSHADGFELPLRPRFGNGIIWMVFLFCMAWLGFCGMHLASAWSDCLFSVFIPYRPFDSESDHFFSSNPKKNSPSSIRIRFRILRQQRNEKRCPQCEMSHWLSLTDKRRNRAR